MIFPVCLWKSRDKVRRSYRDILVRLALRGLLLRLALTYVYSYTDTPLELRGLLLRLALTYVYSHHFRSCEASF